VLSEGGVSLGERLWRRKDGTTLPVEVTANQIQQSGGNLIFVVGRDITERKRAEAAMREKEYLLSEAQRIGHIGSWSYDVPADTFKFSDEMYQLFDVLPQDFDHSSRDFLALVYPADRPWAAKWLEDVKSGRQSKELSFRIFRKNRELCYLRCTGAVNLDDLGRVIRFIGTMQDVTEHRVAEIQINQQIKRLTALVEIDRAIISSSDQRYTLGVILSQIISQLQVDAADVLILDSRSQVLEYAAGQGFRTKTIETARLQLDENHAGRVASERRLIQISDLSLQPNNQRFQNFVEEEGFVTYIGVPLIVKGAVKGVLEIFQRVRLQPYPGWLEFLQALAGQAAIAVENAGLVGDLQASNQELFQAYDATIEGWSRAMDLRDKETEGHTQRVTRLTLELARAQGLEESQLVHIRRGALLHDLGKLGIPDAILHKATALTEEEWTIMRQHPQFAYDMLYSIEYLRPALDIPYCHHEKWDGSGYPRGLQGEDIPLAARLFAITDVWDALTSDRPYRLAWSQADARTYIREQSGKYFDPRIVELFFKVIH
jgi:HD-GYP domain-containing protein (c-di-GMP phosphodiesterase class II)/PAS domain-containing protein